MRRTEAITRCIQELLISAKDEKVQKNTTINFHNLLCLIFVKDKYSFSFIFKGEIMHKKND